MSESVMLVDKNDKVIGEMEKTKAHKTGSLHRALSVFIFNSQGHFLLQRRAKTKYHSGGLWANTCCSHPRINENIRAAAKRRLKEEMGINNVQLKEIFSFIYRAKLDKLLIEHEFDHVLVGNSDILPKINKDEVSDYRYVDYNSLKEGIKNYPTIYAEWFKILIKKYGNILSRYSKK